MIAPKSLTATIYVRFHYQEPEVGALTGGDTQTINKILDQASELSPDLQELLVKFADFLNRAGQPNGQSSN